MAHKTFLPTFPLLSNKTSKKTAKKLPLFSGKMKQNPTTHVTNIDTPGCHAFKFGIWHLNSVLREQALLDDSGQYVFCVCTCAS